MGIKLRHLLMFLLIILKEPDMPEADCRCLSSLICWCKNKSLTSIPQNLPTYLNQLDMRHNLISMIQSGAFVNLPQLQVLRLSWNQITVIQAGTFVNLPLLQVLDLSNNQITMIKEGSFANLPLLRTLWLICNQMKMIHAGTFANLPQLQELRLSLNQITVIQAGTFAHLPHLKKVFMSLNRITMVHANTFVNLPQLQLLALAFNQITMIQAGTFANLPQLQDLRLFNNQITMIQACAFVNLPKLQSLDLRDNMMSAIAPFAFHSLPSSLTIELNGNPWQCDCKMAPFSQDSTEFRFFRDQITCAEPADLRGRKLTDVNHKELVCAEPTISALPVDVHVTCNKYYNGTTADSTTRPVVKKGATLTSPLATTPEKIVNCSFHKDFHVTFNNCYNGTTAGSATGPEGKKRPKHQVKPSETITSPLQTTSDRPETNDKGNTITSMNSAPQTTSKESVSIFPIPILIGSIAGIALISTVILTIWCKRRTENAAPDPSLGPHSNIPLSYLKIIQARQGQSQTITQSNLNTTAALMTSGHDHQYEDIDKQHNQTGQGQSQTITQSNLNTTAAVMTSGHDHQYEDVDKQLNQTRQGQSQANIQLLKF
uniref:LRRCT domain-containing protein n=1 Tax=Branchiostoma floridae TaxID=7739 RepID=C3XWS5_BRAFL|eukprot:XP_002611175.1 hypothetical protein BRAFLDRAFT_88426 [Branchiostoma floridae]